MHSKRIALFALLTFCAILPVLGQSQSVKKEMYMWFSKYNDAKAGVFEYAYLTLYLEQGRVTGGVLNSTTDEYDQAREGYVCGYTVFPLRNIRESGDTLRFTVRVEDEEAIFDVPIAAGVESVHAARELRYPRWCMLDYSSLYYAEPEYTVIRLKDGNLSVRQRDEDPSSDLRIFIHQPTFYVKPQDICPDSW